ncbi:MAG: HIT domain-containing protein [Fervidicoccaceae archaeon]
MKILWAPWRSRYVASFSSPQEERKECVFCEMLRNGKSDSENLIVYRGKRVFVVLNRFPYTSGHFMIVPYRHVSTPEELDEEERKELMDLVALSTKVLKSSYRPDGINMGINLGRVAGAGVEGHLHIHVVPRWIGDTNFLSVIGETRVISDSLESSYKKLKEAFDKVKTP